MSRPCVFLLVEDNEDDAFFMQRAFQAARLQNPLHIVTDGEQAIKYLSGQNGFSDREKYPLPDLIFLDLKMPGLNGFDVLRWIRNDQKSKVPVAVLTSSPEEIDRRKARELGADCYLLKPPEPAMVLGCCKQFHLNCPQTP
ncbi:MAG TPA: response regulator [Candidatus Kapabacteria bacterium]|nr:response regulator [Candidatus Kapabacteria bacterium]